MAYLQFIVSELIKVNNKFISTDFSNDTEILNKGQGTDSLWYLSTRSIT